MPDQPREDAWYDWFIPSKGRGPASFFSSLDRAPPAAPDFMALADKQGQISSDLLDQQTLANRSNQANPFGFSNWTKGADGQWSQSSGFSGPMAGLFGDLQSQAANAWSTPLDNGQQARTRAEDAIYGQAASRLNPMWEQREEQNRTRLINQGFDPNSQAYQRQMDSLGRDRNDAYTSAMNMAITGGGAEAQRQQSMDLQSRNAPLGQLGMLGGLLPGNNGGTAGRASAPDYMGAAAQNYGNALGGYNADLAAQAQQQQALIGAGLSLFGMPGLFGAKK